MVLALGLAMDFPHREILIHMTFGVVILSIIVQGLTMSPLLRKLGVLGVAETEKVYDLERANLRAAAAALKEVDRMIQDRVAHIDLLESLKAEYKSKQEQSEKVIKELHIEAGKLRETELSIAKRHLFTVEKDAVMQAFHNGFITQDAMDKALEEINTKLLALEEIHGN